MLANKIKEIGKLPQHERRSFTPVCLWGSGHVKDIFCVCKRKVKDKLSEVPKLSCQGPKFGAQLMLFSNLQREKEG